MISYSPTEQLNILLLLGLLLERGPRLPARRSQSLHLWASWSGWSGSTCCQCKSLFSCWVWFLRIVFYFVPRRFQTQARCPPWSLRPTMTSWSSSTRTRCVPTVPPSQSQSQSQKVLPLKALRWKMLSKTILLNSFTRWWTRTQLTLATSTSTARSPSLCSPSSPPFSPR